MKVGSPEAIRFSKGLSLTAIFLVLISLPTLDWIFKLDHAPIPNEKRMPASFPSYLGLAHLKDFVSGLNQYYDDHFGFRKRLIRAGTRWKRQIFRAPEQNSVIVGREGWL